MNFLSIVIVNTHRGPTVGALGGPTLNAMEQRKGDKPRFYHFFTAKSQDCLSSAIAVNELVYDVTGSTISQHVLVRSILNIGEFILRRIRKS